MEKIAGVVGGNAFAAGVGVPILVSPAVVLRWLVR